MRAKRDDAALPRASGPKNGVAKGPRHRESALARVPVPRYP